MCVNMVAASKRECSSLAWADFLGLSHVKIPVKYRADMLRLNVWLTSSQKEPQTP